jgi:hypothetical protein
MFRDELEQGRTTFSALPARAKLMALRHGKTAESAIPTAIDCVNVSLIELNACSVEAAMLRYFSGPLYRQPADTRGESSQPQQIGATGHERLPCLLRPGYGLLADSWPHFITYCERGHTTIPLLAVDWLDFHHQLRASQTTRSVKRLSH